MSSSAPDPFEQIGGHPGTVIRTEHGTLIKKADTCERNFYSDLSLRPTLGALTPAYFGEKPFGDAIGVEMSDATHGYSRPCVIDIKMGTRTWGRQASEEKRERATAKDAWTTTSRLGFRLCGYRVYDVVDDCNRETSKYEARAAALEEMPAAFREYLWDGLTVHLEHVPAILDRLKEIRTWFETNGELRFIASSLLMVYEGDPAAASPKPPTVTMIDFAHVEPILPDEDGEDRDNGYLTGLRNLEALLVDL